MSQTKPMTKAELAEYYGISSNTLCAWLKRCGFYNRHPEALQKHILTISELNFIFEKLGKND